MYIFVFLSMGKKRANFLGHTALSSQIYLLKADFSLGIHCKYISKFSESQGLGQFGLILVLLLLLLAKPRSFTLRLIKQKQGCDRI